MDYAEEIRDEKAQSPCDHETYERVDEDEEPLLESVLEKLDCVPQTADKKTPRGNS
jgi:hypothetical protein